MRYFLLEFLKQLEKTIPPPEHAHHAIHCARYGSDKTGWEPKLCLTVNLGSYEMGFQTLFLDDADFHKEPEVLVADIKKLIDEIISGG